MTIIFKHVELLFFWLFARLLHYYEVQSTLFHVLTFLERSNMSYFVFQSTPSRPAEVVQGRGLTGPAFQAPSLHATSIFYII